MCNTTATRRPKLHVFYFGTAANLNANKRWNRKKKTKTKTTDNDDDENFQRQNVLCACSRCQAPVRGRSRKCRNRCCCSFATMHVWFVILVLFFFFFALLSIGHNMRAFIAPFITIERTELRNTCDGPSSHIIFFFVFVAANSSNLELRILRLPPMILPTWQFEADLLLIYFLCVTIFVWQLFGRNMTDDGTSNSQSSHCVVPWILLALYYFAVILLCSWHFEFWQ